MTTQQFKDRSKTVTRRVGWLFLETGHLLCGVKKCQGIKRGEQIERLGIIRVVDVRREQLDRMTTDLDYGFKETIREGFAAPNPLYFPSVFVDFFCESHRGCMPSSMITRIEFEYVELFP